MGVNVPKSPLTKLGDALAQTTPLKGVARVLVGAANLPLTGAPGRIVILPTVGRYKNAKRVPSADADSEQDMVAHIWGDSIDHAWDLQQRLIQALNEHAAAGGPWWDLSTCNWGTTPDTTQQGQVIEVTFMALFAVESLPTDQGRVGANWPAGNVDEVTLNRSS